MNRNKILVFPFQIDQMYISHYREAKSHSFTANSNIFWRTVAFSFKMHIEKCKKPFDLTLTNFIKIKNNVYILTYIC